MYLALGPARVPVAGTPVNLTVVLPASYRPEAGMMHAVMLQALQANTGRIFIGSEGMVKATLAGVGAVLAPYSVIPYHTFSAALTIAPNGLSMATFYLDADTSDEGVLVSLLRT